MNVFLFTALGYCLEIILLAIIIWTLILELCARKSRFVFFLILYFLVTGSLFLVIIYDLFAKHFGYESQHIVGMEMRVILVLIATALIAWDLWSGYFKLKK